MNESMIKLNRKNDSSCLIHWRTIDRFPFITKLVTKIVKKILTI